MPLDDDELNPDHPVTAALHDQWHKLLAVVMHRFKIENIVITKDDILAFDDEHPNCSILAHDKSDGLHLSIISRDAGEELVKEYERKKYNA